MVVEFYAENKAPELYFHARIDSMGKLEWRRKGKGKVLRIIVEPMNGVFWREQYGTMFAVLLPHPMVTVAMYGFPEQADHPKSH